MREAETGEVAFDSAGTSGELVGNFSNKGLGTFMACGHSNRIELGIHLKKRP